MFTCVLFAHQLTFLYFILDGKLILTVIIPGNLLRGGLSAATHGHDIPIKHVEVVLSQQLKLINNSLYGRFLFDLLVYKPLDPALGGIVILCNAHCHYIIDRS